MGLGLGLGLGLRFGAGVAVRRLRVPERFIGSPCSIAPAKRPPGRPS